MPVQNSIEKDKNVNKLRFGILRPLGDITGEIGDIGIKHEDLWKHDEYIHNIQFGRFDINDKKGVANKELFDKFKQIKQRDNYTCYFCSFRDPKFCEVHHKDGNHFNNHDSNLTTACTLCHRQHHLLWLSLNDHAELGAVNVEYLPQTELNHLQRISMVFSDDEVFGKNLGRYGKLGAMIAMMSNSFSRPLHAFMVSDKKRQEHKDDFNARNTIESPFKDFSIDYKTLKLALHAMDRNKPDSKQLSALERLDHFLPAPDQNTKPDEHRAKFSNQIKEILETRDRLVERDFEKLFNDNKEVFSIFELAIALKEIDYNSYKNFDPPFLKLIFKPSIFTPEQIKYYKQMQYFKASEWNLGTEDNVSDLTDILTSEKSE